MCVLCIYIYIYIYIYICCISFICVMSSPCMFFSFRVLCVLWCSYSSLLMLKCPLVFYMLLYLQNKTMLWVFLYFVCIMCFVLSNCVFLCIFCMVVCFSDVCISVIFACMFYYYLLLVYIYCIIHMFYISVMFSCILLYSWFCHKITVEMC